MQSFFTVFKDREKMTIKPKNIDLETILAPLGGPLEAMMEVLGGLWRPCWASWGQLEPEKSIVFLSQLQPACYLSACCAQFFVPTPLPYENNTWIVVGYVTRRPPLRQTRLE